MFKRFSWRIKEPKPMLLDPVDLGPEPLCLNSLHEIHSLQPGIKKLLAYEFDLGESISRLCPVLLTDGKYTQIYKCIFGYH